MSKLMHVYRNEDDTVVLTLREGEVEVARGVVDITLTPEERDALVRTLTEAGQQPVHWLRKVE